MGVDWRGSYLCSAAIDEQAGIMARRIVFTEAGKSGTAVKAYWDPEYQEFVLRVYRDGKLSPDEDYFTDDKQDALETAMAIVNDVRSANPSTPKKSLFRDAMKKQSNVRSKETLSDQKRASAYKNVQETFDKYVGFVRKHGDASPEALNALCVYKTALDRWHSVEMKEFDPVKKNPVAKRNVTVIRRAGVPAKRYVSRPSQITRTTPTKRLKARRKKVAGAPAGYFPNPPKQAFPRYVVTDLKGNNIAEFYTLKEAKEYAQALAQKTGKSYRVIDSQ